MKFKKESDLIKLSFIFLIILFLFGFQYESNEDSIKVTEISLFGYNYTVYFSKIYLAYVILINHYFDCSWSTESKNIIYNLENYTQNIDYGPVQNEKELLQILYKGPYNRGTFFFNSTIFNNFVIEKKYGIPVKNSFNFPNLEQSYNLLLKFYNKNINLISEIAEKITDNLSQYFKKYSKLTTEKSLLTIPGGDKINLLVFFYETSLSELGEAFLGSACFTIEDDIQRNCQTIFHETIHLWFNSNIIFDKIVNYSYKNTLIDYLKIFVEKYGNLGRGNLDTSNNEKAIITYVLSTLYINFDEFFAYEYSKYFCEKNFYDYKGFSFAEMNSSLLSQNTYEDLVKLSNSVLLKSILSTNDNDIFYIKAFILYLLCITVNYQYSVEHYLDYVL